MKVTSLRGIAAALQLCAALAFAATTGLADAGEIRGVRLGAKEGFDRLVLELGPDPVPAFRSGDGALSVEFEAAPPIVGPTLAQRLEELGVRIEGTARGTTRLSVAARGGRQAAAFRLGGRSATSSGRIVVDVGRGDAPLTMPPDAEPLPLGSPGPAAARAERASLGGGSALTPGRTDSSSAQQRSDIPPRPAGGGGGGGGGGSSAEGDEKVWVRMRGLELEGLPDGGPTADQIYALELGVVTAPNGDLRAAPGAQSGSRITLRELASGEPAGRRVGGSVLQQVVERIADLFADRGQFGTRIDIRKRDLEKMVGDQPGPLVIRIQSANAP